MEETTETERGYTAYLLRLHQERDSLERFPRSSYSHALILLLGLPIFVAGLLGSSFVPVPSYLLLPFVAVPGWTLIRRELSWRKERRSTEERIQVIAHRQRLT